MAPKSIFRQSGAQHFQLVHRSLRDPLVDDPDASQQVLKPVGRANERKIGTTLADLEQTERKHARANEGEAALYGITFDDSSYDYMSHLKPVGAAGAIDSVLLAAPAVKSTPVVKSASRGKGKGKANGEDFFDLLPSGVLASRDEKTQEEVFAKQEAIPRELQGLQPDMDPHLRQVLEALDDDAFLEDEDGEREREDWFGELVKGGEAKEGDREEYEFAEWGLDDTGKPKPERMVLLGKRQEEGEKEETWEDRFKAFKSAKSAREVGSDDEIESEMADTVGSLASNLGDMMVIGGKKRRGKRGPSDATGMSMSSSSMFRNEGLRTLDERFDKIERDYEIDDEDEDGDFADDVSLAPSMMSSMSTSSRVSLFSNATVTAPEVSRQDFDAILDDFLDNYEVVGRHMRQTLGTTRLTGTEKLAVLREAVEAEEDGIGKEENRRRIMEIANIGKERGAKEEMERLPLRDIIGKGKEEKWDAETILTTYTNTENHPGMIRSRRPEEIKRAAERRAASQLRISPDAQVAPGVSRREASENVDTSDSGSETETGTDPRRTVSRPKGESTADRKARKAAVKAERAARRVEKRDHRESFDMERKRQLASHKRMVGGGKAADLTVAKGVVTLS